MSAELLKEHLTGRNLTDEEIDHLDAMATIRPIVRGLEDMAKVRIATGNRLVSTWMHQRGIANNQATTDEDRLKLQKERDKMLDRLRLEYTRVTDGIVGNLSETNGAKMSSESLIIATLPKPKDFKPTDIISTYAELMLIDMYVKLINDEQMGLSNLGKALDDVAIYNRWLKFIKGIGPKMAGVLLSEIDLSAPNRKPGSIITYAGIDTVFYGWYKGDDGKKVELSEDEITAWCNDHPGETNMVWNGKSVTFDIKGRDRTKVSMRDVEYTDRYGDQQVRKSLGFNPWLKTKLLGVLIPSFLKSSPRYLDGERAGNAKRIYTAEKLYGFKAPSDPKKAKEQADALLREKGHVIEDRPDYYAAVYFNYSAREQAKNALRPDDRKITAAHIHNRAARFAAKIFLQDYYVAGRTILNLPVYATYARAKLGYDHQGEFDNVTSLGFDQKNLVMDGNFKDGRHPPMISQFIAERCHGPVLETV